MPEAAARGELPLPRRGAAVELQHPEHWEPPSVCRSERGPEERWMERHSQSEAAKWQRVDAQPMATAVQPPARVVAREVAAARDVPRVMRALRRRHAGALEARQSWSLRSHAAVHTASWRR